MLDQPPGSTPARCPSCYHEPHRTACTTLVCVWLRGKKSYGRCPCEGSVR